MADDAVREAERRWLATGAWDDHQALLSARARAGLARYVLLDPAGHLTQWCGLIVERPTGVIYAHRTGGSSRAERFVEGFYVPLGGPSFRGGPLLVPELWDVFHRGAACDGRTNGADLEPERLAQLRAAVEEIRSWRTDARDRADREPGALAADEHEQPDRDSGALSLDERRLVQAVEAWLPVDSPLGPGVLVYENCD